MYFLCPKILQIIFFIKFINLKIVRAGRDSGLPRHEVYLGIMLVIRSATRLFVEQRSQSGPRGATRSQIEGFPASLLSVFSKAGAGFLFFRTPA